MKVVLSGAGPAGVTVAETLRQHDSAEIVMISSEPYPPYSPPAMLEYFSTGREGHFWKGKDFPQALNIDYRPGDTGEAKRSCCRSGLHRGRGGAASGGHGAQGDSTGQIEGHAQHAR